MYSVKLEVPTHERPSWTAWTLSPPAHTMPEPPPANMAWVCQSWCHYNPDANCRRQDCFGCEECPAPEKWWDRSNNYHGESA